MNCIVGNVNRHIGYGSGFSSHESSSLFSSNASGGNDFLNGELVLDTVLEVFFDVFLSRDAKFNMILIAHRLMIVGMWANITPFHSKRL